MCVDMLHILQSKYHWD